MKDWRQHSEVQDPWAERPHLGGRDITSSCRKTPLFFQVVSSGHRSLHGSVGTTVSIVLQLFSGTSTCQREAAQARSSSGPGMQQRLMRQQYWREKLSTTLQKINSTWSSPHGLWIFANSRNFFDTPIFAIFRRFACTFATRSTREQKTIYWSVIWSP